MWKGTRTPGQRSCVLEHGPDGQKWLRRSWIFQNSDKILKKVKNAGCIFIGSYCSEAFGDYIVGTNHILPTFGSAKFSSGLGVLDFMKRSSYVYMDKSNYLKLANKVIDMATIENLEGHKLSVTIRQKDKK